MKKTLIIFLLAIFMINVPPIKFLFRNIIDDNHYKYSNAGGTWKFQEIPSKGLLADPGIKVLGTPFLEKYPNSADTLIYRLFDKNWFCFWRWGEYIIDDRYSLPFIDAGEIRRNRLNLK